MRCGVFAVHGAWQISRGVESLFNKLRAEFEDTSPEWTGAVECDDCSRLALCVARLELLSVELSEQPVFREILAKMQCTLFQVGYARLKPLTRSPDE